MALELRHFRALVAAADHATLTEAAETLHVSQPTLTRTLQQLERMAGCPFLLRSAHGTTLTDAGEHAVGCAREILTRVDAFLPDLAHQRTLRLGFAWLLPPAWFAGLRRVSGDRGITVTPVRVDDPVAALTTPSPDRVDLALFRNSHRPLPSGVASRTLGSEPRHAVFPADSDLARRYLAGEEIRWDDLSREPLVTNPNSGTTWPGSWPDSPEDRTVIECANFEEWIELVAAGAGIGAVPELARLRAPHPGVVYAQLPDIPPSELALAWSRDALTPDIAELLDLLRVEPGVDAPGVARPRYSGRREDVHRLG